MMKNPDPMANPGDNYSEVVKERENIHNLCPFYHPELVPRSSGPVCRLSLDG